MWDTQVLSLRQEDPLEKEMAIHSSSLAWKIPWTEEPSRLQPVGSQRVGPDWATSLSFSPTPVFWPGEFHGLYVYSPWDHKELDRLSFDSVLNKSCIWCLPLQHSSPYSSFYISERRQQRHRNTRFNYWITMPTYDCHWNNARGRNQDPNNFVPHRQLLTGRPPLIEALDSSWSGAQFLRHEPTVVPSPPTENKSHLSVFSKLCLHIFCSASVGREGQDFGQQQLEVLEL